MTHYFQHEKLLVYQKAINFVSLSADVLRECRGKAAARDHLHRAASSIPIRIAEANSKPLGKARVHLLDVAYGSSLESAACLDVLSVRGRCDDAGARSGKQALREIVSMLLGLRRSGSDESVEVGEDEAHYGKYVFDHEALPVYQSALALVSWCGDLADESRFSVDVSDGLDTSTTSVALNIAEGNGKFSQRDRSRFLEIAHTSALRCAATLDVSVATGQTQDAEITEGKRLLSSIVGQLIGWQRSLIRPGTSGRQGR